MTGFTFMAIYGGAGLVAGFILQRSRLCFVSAFRDLFLFRATGMTRSILLLLMLTSLGGGLVTWLRSGMGHLTPVIVGPDSLVVLMGGGLLFGIGMILAGSCATTALWRMGEGQLSQVWILPGLLLGVQAYAHGPQLAPLVVQGSLGTWQYAAIIAAVLAALVTWERSHRWPGEELPSTTRPDWRRPWSSDVGAIALAVIFLLFVGLTGSIWRVTTAFLFDRAALSFAVGLILGGHLSARFGHEYRVRTQGTWPERLLRFSGGLLMGYGARMATGCTVGLLLSGSVVAATQTLWWLGSAAVGAWFGSRLLRLFMERQLRS